MKIRARDARCPTCGRNRSGWVRVKGTRQVRLTCYGGHSWPVVALEMPDNGQGPDTLFDEGQEGA